MGGARDSSTLDRRRVWIDRASVPRPLGVERRQLATRLRHSSVDVLAIEREWTTHRVDVALEPLGIGMAGEEPLERDSDAEPAHRSRPAQL